MGLLSLWCHRRRELLVVATLISATILLLRMVTISDQSTTSHRRLRNQPNAQLDSDPRSPASSIISERLLLPPADHPCNCTANPSSPPVSTASSSFIVHKPTTGPATPLAIVYFAAINPDHPKWQALIAIQLQELQDWGLAAHATSIHVELSADGVALGRDQASALLEEASRVAQGILPKAMVSTYPVNENEYRGIHRVWDVSRHLPPSAVVLYFHSKGMWNVREPDRRDPQGVRDSFNYELTQYVIRPWEEVLQAFEERPDMDKAGQSLHRHGWWVGGC